MRLDGSVRRASRSGLNRQWRTGEQDREPAFAAVAVNPLNGHVYVANSGDNTVTVLTGSDGTELAQIPVRGVPNGIAVNASTQRVYVSNRDSNDVTVIDAISNNVLVSSVPVGLLGTSCFSMAQSTTNMAISTLVVHQSRLR
jgi:YVTN family beta-propeller protein